MKKIFIVLMILVMTLAMAACGAGGSSSDAAPAAAVEEEYEGFTQDYGMAEEAPAAESADIADSSKTTSSSGTEASVGLPKSYGKTDVKLIYRADISVQTLDFGEAVKGLNALTEKFGGYFESVTSDNGSYYDDSTYKYGNYTVRIPSDKYQDFINSLSEGMHVVNMSQNAEDIGQVYFDTERRVETLKNKHERLEELLKKATKMSDIIELEGALSETEYELEQYTSELKRYDSLVSYSTINLSIEQVSQYDMGVQEELSFGQRLLRSLKTGAGSFGEGIENLIIWFGYHIIQLVILAVIIVVIVKFHLINKIGKLFGGKKKQERYVLTRKTDDKEEENK